jgi:nitrogen fixation-related uncharacterized protein
MFTHAMVLKTLIVYLFIKATIFAPIAVAGVVSWWAERQGQEDSESGEVESFT